MGNTPNNLSLRMKRLAGMASILAVGGVGGAVLANGATANAATPSPAPVTSSSSTDSTAGALNSTTHMRGNYPAHGTAAEEALEKPVTGSAATSAQAAAVKAAGGGTAGAVTTDVSGNGYEVTVTKADGSTTEIHLNGSFGVDDHNRTASGA